MQICKIIISLGVFFNFKVLIFQVVRGLKGPKMTQNDKSFCLSHLIYLEPYIIIWSSSYDLHLWYTCMSKRIISPGIFFFFFNSFSKFWFSVSFCLSHSISQEPYIKWLWFLVHMCKMMISPVNFFIFQNFDFWNF